MTPSTDTSSTATTFLTGTSLVRPCIPSVSESVSEQAIFVYRLRLVGNAAAGGVDSRRGHGARQVRGDEGGHVSHVLQRLSPLEHGGGYRQPEVFGRHL